MPVYFDAEIQTLNSLSDLIDSFTADVVWRRANCANDLHFAITLGALSLLRDAGEEVGSAKLRQFALGSEFMASLERVECLGDGRYGTAVRELCSQLVAGKCNRQVNPFSLTGQYVRTFDGAKAWRTHVTNAGLALRLMHWDGKNGIEFANVDVKSGERIEVGENKPAARLDFSDLI
ncbi:hypothetical protein V6582_16860 [Agrobacterium vitis]|uniref:hypothetical protein n=1 Tax=Agrobacterium vitis TaxID=373 RepID=UPI0030E12C59